MTKKTCNVLIIDDDLVDRENIKRLLRKSEKFEYHTVELTHAKEALEIYKNSSFDCILLDYILPDMDGISFLNKINAKSSMDSPPIIMLTGEGNEEIAVNALKAGALDYILKDNLTTNLLEKTIINSIIQHTARVNLEQKEHKFEFMALHDLLTQLPNKLAFDHAFKRFISSAERYQRLSALLSLELNNFKSVYDTLGHEITDLLLQEISIKLKNQMREDDMIARVGDDKFAILLNEIHEENDAIVIADKICQQIQTPFKIKEHSIQMGISIGIVFFPTDTNNPDVLIDRADKAIHQAKSKRKIGYEIY